MSAVDDGVLEWRMYHALSLGEYAQSVRSAVGFVVSGEIASDAGASAVWRLFSEIRC